MFERVLRRLLWVLPSCLAVSLLTFYALSRVPEADVSPASPHARYRALPLFFNTSPHDVRAAVERPLGVLTTPSSDSMGAKEAGAELARIGGAALPFVLPKLDAFEPEARLRVALALAPLARRMQLDDAHEAEDPRTALRFWSRFWVASEVEFRLATARNAARRWTVYGDPGREREVFRLDTFALEALFELLPTRVEPADLERIRRTIDVLAHVTDRDDRVAASATVADAEACIVRWRQFWLGKRTDFVQLRGSDRIAAFALESRFGKWAVEELAGTADATSATSGGAVGASATYLRLAVGWLLAQSLAIGVGVWSALARRRARAHATAALFWATFAAGPVLTGSLLALKLGFGVARDAAAVVALALVLAARPYALVRGRVTAVLDSDAARGARARGASRGRVAWTMGLRDALAPTLASSLLDLPYGLTACFVLERALGLSGLGEATLASASHGDVAHVMRLAVVATAWGVLALVLGDVTLSAVEPQTAGTLFKVGQRG